MAKLGDLVRTQKGFAFKSSWYQKEGVPIVRVTDFTLRSIDLRSAKYISEDIAKSYAKYKLLPGDILVQTVGSWPSNPRSVVGKVVKVPSNLEGALLNQNIVKLLPKDNTHGQYLFYLLKSKRYANYIVNTAQGAASQAAITLDSLLNFPVPDISLSKQKDIANFLSRYDELIEKNEKNIEIAEELLKEIYFEWFVRFRFPGFDEAKGPAKKETLPEGWEKIQLGDIASVVRGRSYKSSEVNHSGNGTPFLNLKNIMRGGGFNMDGTKFFTGTYSSQQNIVPGDLIMAVTDMTHDRGIVARSARVPNIGYDNYTFSMDVVKINVQNQYMRKYLYYSLRYSRFADEIKMHANGANVLHLSPKSINDYDIVVPSQTIMKHFADIADRLESQIDILLQSNLRLSKIGDMMLPKILEEELEI